VCLSIAKGNSKESKLSCVKDVNWHGLYSNLDIIFFYSDEHGGRIVRKKVQTFSYLKKNVNVNITYIVNHLE